MVFDSRAFAFGSMYVPQKITVAPRSIVFEPSEGERDQLRLLQYGADARERVAARASEPSREFWAIEVVVAKDA